MVRASGGDEGGAGGGVEEEEVGEGVGVGGGGVLVVDVIKEGGVDGAAGNGGVGVEPLTMLSLSFCPQPARATARRGLFFFPPSPRAILGTRPA